jgi:uncharacterized Zn finger protein
MKEIIRCPICLDSRHVRINLKTDGFTKYMFECGNCGSFWILSGNVSIVMNNRNYSQAKI